MSVGQTEDASPTVSRTAPEVLESIPRVCTFSYKEDDIQPKPEGPELNRAHKDQFIHYEETAEGIEFVGFEELLNCHDTDIDSPGSLVGQGNNDEHLESCYLPKYIEGPASLRGKIDKMLPEFIEIFSKKLRRKPADLPPMELTVEKDKWESSKNAGQPRQQTEPKQAEIRRQVSALLPIGVIAECQAPYYSQAHLTPKPQGQWRFALDYRNLNDCCKSMGWPIPNIRHMLQRLGSKKPRYFAKIDLTHGYHQAPLHENSWLYTAFITFMGIYYWLRVPMGLKAAPSYFQGALATCVLVGLIYQICELYIDDIIVHGKTEDEFVDNLRQVFTRLKNKGLVVNPDKCFIGMTEVEFVGHIINS